MRQLFLLLPLLAAVACSSSTPEVPTPEASPEAAPSTSSPNAPPEAAPKPVRLAFGGDVHFEGVLSEGLSDPKKLARAFPPELAAADYSMVNLETALTTVGKPTLKELEDPPQRYHFRAPSSALTALELAGVDVASQANNHSADFGPKGVEQALEWKEEAPLALVGLGGDAREAYAPHEVTLSGQKFAFFAADASKLESRNPLWRAGEEHPGVAAVRTPREVATLTARIGEAKEAGAFVVVYLHWGEEGEVCTTPGQEELARALSQAGAGLLVGTHAHRLQAQGWLNEDTYVAYGLSDFAWYHGRQGGSGLLEVTVKEGRLQKPTFTPLAIPEAGGVAQPVGKREARATREALQEALACSNLTEEKPGAEAFQASVSRVPAEELGKSWRPGCPVAPRELRKLTVSHHTFNRAVATGEIIVHESVVRPTTQAFRSLFRHRFPLRELAPVTAYGADDGRSMAANNSSGYNCRPVQGSTAYSKHAHGLAFDLNPVQNPYLTRGGVLPEKGEKYARERKPARGVLTASHPVVRDLEALGWTWGGRWTGEPDYQHFVWER